MRSLYLCTFIIGCFLLFFSFQCAKPKQKTTIPISNSPRQLLHQQLTSANANNDYHFKDSILNVALLYSIEKLGNQDSVTAYIYHKLGVANTDVDHVKTLAYFHKALAIRKALHLELDCAKTKYNIASLFINQLDINYKAALDTLQQVATIREKYPIEGDNAFELASCYQQMGVAYDEMEDSENAILYGKKALRLFLSLQTRYEIASTYSNIAIAFEKYYQPDSQLVYFRQALVFQDDPFDKAKATHNLGVFFRRKLSDYPSSLAYLNNALTSFITLKDTAFQSRSLLEIAKTNVYLKKYDEALKQVAKSYALAAYNPNQQTLSDCKDVEGNIYKELGNYQKASECYEKAIGYALRDTLFSLKNNTITLENYPKASLSDLKIILPNLANNYFTQYKKSKNSQDAQNALRLYQLTDQIVVKLRHSLRQDGSKFLLAEDLLPIYEEAIAVADALHDNEAALHFIESNKAPVFLENMQAKQAMSLAGIPDAKIKHVRALQIELANWEKEVDDNPNDATLRDSLFQANRSLEQFGETLESDYPAYYNLKYDDKDNLSISDIQQNLNDDKGVLEYFLGDSTLYIFAISKDKSVLLKEALPRDFDARFEQLLNYLSSTSENTIENDFKQSSSFSYQLLVEKALKYINSDKKITRLRIIPDGKLGYLSFDIFAPQGTDYLIKNYATSYVYSNKLLFPKSLPWGQRIQQFFNSFRLHYVGFGVSYDNETLEKLEQKIGDVPQNSQKAKKLFRLELAAKHIKDMAKLLDGEAFTNNDATIANFKLKAREANILQLYIHSMITDKNPLSSRLVFSKDTSKHFSLSTSDIYTMQFHAGLAVLGACNTGVGEIKRGEGIMSLARAYSFANCQSLILSLWSIPEQQTTEILNSFYSNLRTGQPKDVALQQAKIAYLMLKGTSEESKPNFWAATVCVGNVDALYWTMAEKTGLAFGIILVLIGGGLWAFRSRSFRSRPFRSRP
ncbi:MAG: hypothetical protein RLZZ292_3842 [Bacteroidota bacterium]